MVAKNTIESKCPICNKKVNGIPFEPTRPVEINGDITTIRILGCPECNNLFFKRDD